MAYDSPHYDILLSVQALILSLENPALGDTQVKVRDSLVYMKEEDDLPLVILTPGGDDVGDMTFPNQDHIDYGVQVALIVERKLVREGLAWQLFWRQRLRQKLRTTTLELAAGVYDVTRYVSRPVFDRAGLDRLFGVSVQEFVYRSVEDREI